MNTLPCRLLLPFICPSMRRKRKEGNIANHNILAKNIFDKVDKRGWEYAKEENHACEKNNFREKGGNNGQRNINSKASNACRNNNSSKSDARSAPEGIPTGRTFYFPQLLNEEQSGKNSILILRYSPFQTKLCKRRSDDLRISLPAKKIISKSKHLRRIWQIIQMDHRPKIYK